MGLDPPDGAGLKQLPAQGPTMDIREAANTEGRGKIGISSDGGSDGEGGLRGYQGLHHE